MFRREALAVLAVFFVVSFLDFILNGVLLASTYEATSGLWRPMSEVSFTLVFTITLAISTCFVTMYSLLIEKKSLGAGLRFGSLFGLAIGIYLGFGSYAYMPIPVSLAISWLVGSVIEMTVAGALVGVIVHK
ncbi:conserved membrane hypothetical protein [Gammaproteobacteria bacterium]